MSRVCQSSCSYCSLLSYEELFFFFPRYLNSPAGYSQTYLENHCHSGTHISQNVSFKKTFGQLPYRIFSQWVSLIYNTFPSDGPTNCIGLIQCKYIYSNIYTQENVYHTCHKIKIKYWQTKNIISRWYFEDFGVWRCLGRWFFVGKWFGQPRE